MSDIATAPAFPTAAARRGSAMGDSLIMVGRCIRLTRRNFEALLMSVILPVMLMLLFVYLFGGAIHTGTAYVTYIVPGVLLLCAGFGASLTAVSVCHDMSGGIMERFRSMDVSGAAVLGGHVAASVARNAVSTVLVFGLAFLIGFRATGGPLDWLAAAGILLVFMLAISWLSAAIGLLTRSPEAASGFTFFISFVPYVSSAFVPIDTLPWWLQWVARNQPLTPIIETIRGLLLHHPLGTDPWRAVGWSATILVVSIALSRALFQRRAA